MENLIDLKGLKDIKCVKVVSERELAEKRGDLSRRVDGIRQYFTCMQGDKRLVIVRNQSRNNGEYVAFANEEGLIGNFSHYNRYYDFPSEHEGIGSFDYDTGAEFEDSLDAAVVTYSLEDKNKEREKLLDFVHSNDVISAIYSDKFQKLEDKASKKETVYKQIAKDALISWNGLSQEEATKKVLSTKNSDLEKEVYAEGSINYAIEGIMGYISNNGFPLRKGKYDTVRNIIMNSPVESHALAHFFGPYFKNLEERGSKEWKTEMALSALSRIHDGWVKDNQKKFMSRDKKYQHMPIELIGWKEVKSDLLFLNPILQSMGINIPENDLEKAYDNKVKEFFKNKGIKSIDELGEHISKGASFYRPLEGQEDILQALQNPQFVSETLIPSIKERGVGADEHAMKRVEQWKNRSSSLATARARKQELKQEAKLIGEAEKLIDEKENGGKGEVNE